MNNQKFIASSEEQKTIKKQDIDATYSKSGRDNLNILQADPNDEEDKQLSEGQLEKEDSIIFNPEEFRILTANEMEKFRKKQKKINKPYLLHPLKDEDDLEDENRLSTDEYKDLAIKAKKEIKMH